MNPSTDADNFEKTNCVKGKTLEMSGDRKQEIDQEDREDIIQCYQTSYYEEYDEVFEDIDDGEVSTRYSNTKTTRIRRISDVIDSIGDVSPSHTTKEKSHSFSYDNVSSYRNQELTLQSPPKGRIIPINTMTDSPSSPPMTPGSDLGYGSTGMPTPPSNSRRRPFRFSMSSVDIPGSPPQWDTQLDSKAFAVEPQTSMRLVSLSIFCLLLIDYLI